MFRVEREHKKSAMPGQEVLSPGEQLDELEKAVLAFLKPYGFRKFGRTLHRFVSGDISQVISFQLGQSYREETHLLTIHVGIRVPECASRCFFPPENSKQYYPDYTCNIRSALGNVAGGEGRIYNLQQPLSLLLPDILAQIEDFVIPCFQTLSTREAIIDRRREFPDFDQLGHLILLEESMIYGRWGDIEEANRRFTSYYSQVAQGRTVQKNPQAIENHLRYLEKLGEELGLDVPQEQHDL